MRLGEAIGLPLLRRLDPETAHGLALSALRAGLGPSGGPVTTPRLATTLAGLALPNPLGLAAGLDKNAVAVPAALGSGLESCMTPSTTSLRRMARWSFR